LKDTNPSIFSGKHTLEPKNTVREAFFTPCFWDSSKIWKEAITNAELNMCLTLCVRKKSNDIFLPNVLFERGKANAAEYL
jgi:hypothetical protein